MITHEEFRQLISVDRRLTQDELSSCDTHMKECVLCRQDPNSRTEDPETEHQGYLLLVFLYTGPDAEEIPEEQLNILLAHEDSCPICREVTDRMLEEAGVDLDRLTRRVQESIALFSRGVIPSANKGPDEQ